LAATLDDFEATELKLLEMDDAAETALADALAADALLVGNRKWRFSNARLPPRPRPRRNLLTSPTQTEPKRTS
jgi:hypothetical protein